MRGRSFRTIVAGALLTCWAGNAAGITITGTNEADDLVSALILPDSGVTVTDAALGFGGGSALPSSPQAGSYTNAVGTYGLPGPGIVLSSGFVANYESIIPNTDVVGDDFNGLADFFSGGDGLVAGPEQNDLLGDLTGQSLHFDPVQLDITFDVDADTNRISFVGVFGSEEWPEFVDSDFNDGFGLFLNGENIAGVLPTGASPGDPLLPVNIEHPDMRDVPGTELDGVLAPNGLPLLRFDAPVTPGSTGNTFTAIIGDASDRDFDSTVYLSSFGNFASNNGDSEFTPLLPANPPDPVTGEFVFELPPVEDETVWIDPPVSVGFEYTVENAAFASVTAPSALTVPDPDGYTLSFTSGGGLQDFALATGSTFDFSSFDPVFDFTLSDIDPTLSLDPKDPLAFPTGIALTDITGTPFVGMTPLTDDGPAPVPAPGGLLVLGAGLLYMGRRRYLERRD